jgi:acyl carrier protein
MTDNDLMQTVRTALFAVAPDLEDETIDPGRRLRDQFEFDSMDFVRFMVELHRATGVNVPEKEYPKLESLDGCVTYLSIHSRPL